MSQVRAFRSMSIPQSGLLSQDNSLRFSSGHSGPVLTLSNAGPKQCSLCLPAQTLVASRGCRHLCCFSAGGVTIGHVTVGLNYLFIFPPGYVDLCGSKARHRLGSENVSWCLETSLFFKTPFLGWSSVPTSFVSFCLLYFFLPPFEDNGLLFWVPGVLCQHSEAVLWNLLSV